MGQPLKENSPITWKAKYGAQWGPDVPSDAEYVPRNAGGFHRQARDAFYPLKARVRSLTQEHVVEFIDDLTVSQEGAPEWVLIEDIEFERRCRATRNGIHEALDYVMAPERQWVERRPYAGDRRKWEYCVHRENFTRGELRPFRKLKCRPRKGAVRADHAVAAYSSSPDRPVESLVMPTPVGIPSPPGPVIEMPTPVGIVSQPGCPFSEARCAGPCERPLLLKKIEELKQASTACSMEVNEHTERVIGDGTTAASRDRLGDGAVSGAHGAVDTGCSVGLAESDADAGDGSHDAHMAARTFLQADPRLDETLIQRWVRLQPWAYITSDRYRQLWPHEIQPILADLREKGWPADAFVNQMVLERRTIGNNVDSAVALIRSFIRALPPRAYSAAKRLPDRSGEPPG